MQFLPLVPNVSAPKQAYATCRRRVLHFFKNLFAFLQSCVVFVHVVMRELYVRRRVIGKQMSSKNEKQTKKLKKKRLQISLALCYIYKIRRKIFDFKTKLFIATEALNNASKISFGLKIFFSLLE